MSFPVGAGQSGSGWYSQQDPAATRSAELSQALEYDNETDGAAMPDATAARGPIRRFLGRLRRR